MYLVNLTINMNVLYVSSISNYKHECSVCLCAGIVSTMGII